MAVTESPRIDELRRRVQKDPTSIAFAQLAEEYRRVGGYEEAVDVCRAGLARHPAYLSARVTLARAQMELARYDEAQAELDVVLDLAPDNLAAIRALAEIHQRRGEAGSPPRKEAPPAPRVEAARPAPPLRAPEADRSASAKASAVGPESAEAGAAMPASAEAAAGRQVGQEQIIETPERIAEPTVHVRVERPEPVEPPLAAAPRSFEAFDALDALTLDLPPAPDFSSWILDTTWSPPVPNAAPAIAAVSPASAAVTPASAAVTPASAAMTPEPAVVDPAIDELQQWLAAIVSDRANRR